MAGGQLSGWRPQQQRLLRYHLLMSDVSISLVGQFWSSEAISGWNFGSMGMKPGSTLISIHSQLVVKSTPVLWKADHVSYTKLLLVHQSQMTLVTEHKQLTQSRYTATVIALASTKTSLKCSLAQFDQPLTTSNYTAYKLIMSALLPGCTRTAADNGALVVTALLA